MKIERNSRKPRKGLSETRPTQIVYLKFSDPKLFRHIILSSHIHKKNEGFIREHEYYDVVHLFGNTLKQ